MDNTEKTVSFNDLLKSISGAYSEDEPKVGVAVYYDVVSDGEQKPVTNRVITRMGLGVSRAITRQGDFIQVSIAFPSAGDSDLIGLWNMLQQYGALFMDDSSDFPALSFIFVPMEYKGVYSIMAASPISWALQPSFPGESEINTIRILFDTDDFGLYKANFSEYEKIVAEANKLQDKNDEFFDDIDDGAEDDDNGDGGAEGDFYVS